MEEAGRELGRLRGAVERAVVGQHLHPDRLDAAVAGRGDLAAHVVVAGEGGAHEVLGAVLHPLDRLAGDDRADDRTDISRINPDLSAEAAADVRRDHPDLVLGQPGHHRVQRAVRVRRLRRAPDRELAGDLVEVGERAARLQRRRMHARVDHVLRDRHLRPLEDRVGPRLVPGLPVEDVVVGTPFEIVPDHRGAGVEGVPGVDDRVEGLVLDVDQLQGVARRVGVLRHHERDLLPLEAHLVRGQHGLRVLRQRGHPGQVQPRQGLAGDDRPDLRMRLSRARVDGDDAGVGMRAAQDGAVQHAGQPHVVGVVAAPPDEARVLLAVHGSVAHLPASAAHRIDRTMFS